MGARLIARIESPTAKATRSQFGRALLRTEGSHPTEVEDDDEVADHTSENEDKARGRESPERPRRARRCGVAWHQTHRTAGRRGDQESEGRGTFPGGK